MARNRAVSRDGGTGSIDSIWFTAGFRLWEASPDAEDRASEISGILEILQLPLQLRDGVFQFAQPRRIG